MSTARCPKCGADLVLSMRRVGRRGKKGAATGVHSIVYRCLTCRQMIAKAQVVVAPDGPEEAR